MADPVAEALVGGSEDVIARAREIRLGKRFGQEFPPDAGRPIQNAVLSHELAIIRLWDYAFDKSADSRGEKRMFHELCGDCLDLLKALPEPQDRAGQMLHRLKLISYAYLGERWEEAQEVAGDVSEPSGVWKDRVFESIFSSLLLLARKKRLADLKGAKEAVGRLRQEQKSMEGPYLDGVDAEYGREAAHELASLYHLARCVEATAGYAGSGLPRDIRAVLDMLFDKAFYHCRRSGQKDLEVVERMLELVLKKMVENSVWSIPSRTARIKELVDGSLNSDSPVFELLYPQRTAVLDGGLLDPTSHAAIVSMPTSSGKTLMAELRIIQALKQDEKSWVAYVAPTRALVNQITGRLRRRLRPLGIKVEKMSGAIDLDTFEQSMVGSRDGFDVLVMTPEKMSMLIRRKTELAGSLSLAVIDEAHNLLDHSRGLNLEMLLAMIKGDSGADLLLLTPFLSDGEKVAEWLNPNAPKIITTDLGWRSGDSVAGLFYPRGRGREFATYFLPLAHFSSVGTGGKRPERKELKMGDAPSGYTFSKAKTKYVNAAIAAARLAEAGKVLIVNGTVKDTWKTAGVLKKIMPKLDGRNELLLLAKKFVGAELGDEFPLAGYLDHGIGVHNAGLPDEIRQLVEWLMDRRLLRVLVSTTTMAQGVDFPVSAVLLASYFHPHAKTMQPHEFYNIAGRTGRVGQQGIGLVGIATDGSDKEARKAAEFLREKSFDAASVIEGLVRQAMQGPEDLDLHKLATDPRWSSFVQYMAHMYNQAEDLRDYASRIEISLRNTYGYHRMDEGSKGALIRAVNEYGRRLDERKEFSRLSDVTGFSPETMEDAAQRVKSAGITESDWSGPGLFSGSRLPDMMKEMTEMPEMRLADTDTTASKTLGHDALGRIISDWVSGKSIPYISRAHFGGAGVKQLPECVQAIYGKISQYAAWGLSAMRQACRAEGGANLPAMVYYGVNSDEAVLMRMNSMPRSVSGAMGRAYAAEQNIVGARPSDVRGWLNDLGDSGWDSAVPPYSRMPGSEYKQVWRRLAGLD